MKRTVVGIGLALTICTTAALLAAAPSHAADLFDPLKVVQERGGLLDSQLEAKKLAPSPQGSTPQNSTIRSVDISPLSPGSTKRLTTDSVRVEVAMSASHGFVTGTKDGRNVSYVVIKDASAPSDYHFRIGSVGEGLKLIPDNRGGVTVLDSSGNLVNTILAPWAKDANGKNLPTSYSVVGNRITQHVDTKGATFPVVADPQYGCGVGWCSVYFNRAETHDIATGGIAALGGATAACGVGRAVAVAACGLASGALAWTAITADNHGNCVGLSFWGVYPFIGWNPFEYNGVQCR